MAIADLVNYDQTITVDLKHPGTGESVGVQFEVRSIENEDAQYILRRRRARAMSKMASSGKKAASDDDVADILSDMIEPDGEILATCVVGWDWGGQEFEDGEGVLEWSPENAEHVMTHQSTRWIRPQVQTAAQNIGNFTQA